MKKMRIKKRVTAAGLVLLLLCSMMMGCGAGDKLENTDSYYGDTAANALEESYDDAGFVSEGQTVNEEEEMKTQNTESGSGEQTQNIVVGQTKNVSQKIIKRYNYSYETEHFDAAFSYLKERVERYGGYISNSRVAGDNYDTGYRTLSMTARIPAEQSDEFVSGLGELGTVVTQSQSAEDVTLQYSDTESRIETLETEQERLLSLLEKADSLETIITLEDRLTEVRYELESYQSRKKMYDSLIHYSTIDITLSEVKYTVEVDESTFFSRIATGLERSLRDVISGLVGFVEFIIIHLPYCLVWGIIIFAIVKMIRRLVRRTREKKEKKRAESTKQER